MDTAARPSPTYPRAVDKSVPIGLPSGAARTVLLASLALVALAVLGLATAANAAAQTYTVSNLTDSGVENDGSLRGEVKAANADPGPDTIVFASEKVRIVYCVPPGTDWVRKSALSSNRSKSQPVVNEDAAAFQSVPLVK